jgi:hypothetical protein
MRPQIPIFFGRYYQHFTSREYGVELFVYADPWAIVFHTTGKASWRQ